MATKAEIEATITALQDGGLNTAAELRTALSILKNELYPTGHICRHTLPNKIIRVGTNTTSEYELELKKIGNTVFLQGIFIGTGATTTGYFLEITDDVFKYNPNSKTITHFFDGLGTDGNRYAFSISNFTNGHTRFNSLNTIPSDVGIYINIQYNCND